MECLWHVIQNENKDTSGVNLYLYIVSFFYEDSKIWVGISPFISYHVMLVLLSAIPRFYQKSIPSIDPKDVSILRIYLLLFVYKYHANLYAIDCPWFPAFYLC